MQTLNPATDTIVADWLSALADESGPQAEKNYRSWLKPFCEWLGDRPLEALTTRDVMDYRRYVQGRYAASSVNQYLMAAKRFLRYAVAMGWREPLQLDAVRLVRVEPRGSKAWSREQVADYLDRARNRVRREDGGESQVWVHLALQYGCCLRPSEVVRWANGEAVEDAPGVWRLRGKTTACNGIERRILVCRELMPLVPRLRPQYSGGGVYWRAVTETIDVGPHRFRHSAFTHLLERLGSNSLVAVKLFGGHYGALGMTARYAEPDWARLRSYGRVLAEQVAFVG